MIDISVVVPIYNTPEDYLKKCINAMLSQSKSEIEIILINDGSTNNALSICESFAEIDERIIIINQENKGVSVARNAGIESSRGQWIAFIDPDDWIESEYLESLWRTKKDNTDIVITNCYINEYQHEYKNDFLPDDGVYVVSDKSLLISQLVSKTLGGFFPKYMAVGVPWGKLFKKDFLLKYDLKFIPGMVRMQDNIFCLYAFYSAGEIVFNSERYYHYRKETNSVSFKYNTRIVDHFERYFVETERFINNKMNSDKRYMSSLNVKRATSFNSYFKYFIFHPENKKSNKKELVVNVINMDGNKKALNNIDYSYCTLKEKLFVYLLKHKLIFVLRLAYLVM